MTRLAGRTAIVTGASSGIGLATAGELASRGAHVVLAVRNADKGGAVAATLPGSTEVRRLDLADLASVRKFTDDWDGPVDLLINNAGVSARNLQRTADGFELQFGTNHLGHFALTNLLLPHVRGRVVTVASQAERMGRLDPDDPGWDRRPYRESSAYAASKLANLLFTFELQRRLAAAGSAVIATAAHPGFVATSIYEQPSTGRLTKLFVRMAAQDAQAGSLPLLHAALADVPGGSFSGPRHLLHMRGGAMLIGSSSTARDEALAARLWTVSEQLTSTRFPW